MDKNQHKDFDNFFQDKLNDRQFEYQDDFWAEMETLLPENNTDVVTAGNTRRRRFIFGFLLLCLIGFMSWLIYPQNGSVLTHKNKQSKNLSTKSNTVEKLNNQSTSLESNLKSSSTLNPNMTVETTTKQTGTKTNKLHQNNFSNTSKAGIIKTNKVGERLDGKQRKGSGINDQNIDKPIKDMPVMPRLKRKVVAPNTIKTTTKLGENDILANNSNTDNATIQTVNIDEEVLKIETGNNGNNDAIANDKKPDDIKITTNTNTTENNQSNTREENESNTGSSLVDIFNKESGRTPKIDVGKELNLPFVLTKKFDEVSEIEVSEMEIVEPTCDGCPYIPGLHSLKIGLVAGLSGSNGWKNTMDFRARPSFDPTAGLRLSYLHSPISEWSANAELLYWSRSSLNAQFSYDSTSYGFGATTVSRTTNIEELHYISLPLYAVYAKQQQHQFLGGVTLGYLLNTHSTTTGNEQATTSSSTDLITIPFSQQWGYTAPFRRFDIGLMVGYDYEIMSGWKVGTRVNYNFMDVTKKEIFGNDTYDNNLNIKVVLTCDLLKLKF